MSQEVHSSLYAFDRISTSKPPIQTPNSQTILFKRLSLYPLLFSGDLLSVMAIVKRMGIGDPSC